jgi:glutathione peroxidase
MSVYDFKVNTIDGDEIKLEDYNGKVLVIVNTASKCGFTPQYSELEKLYKKYKDKGLEVLGFPCNQFGEQEPGTSDEIKNFCLINYGVTFPLFEKVNVKGDNASPLFNYLTANAPFKGIDENHPIGKRLSEIISVENDTIKWNFTKFLINRSGNVINRFEPTAEPVQMESEIEKLL